MMIDMHTAPRAPSIIAIDVIDSNWLMVNRIEDPLSDAEKCAFEKNITNMSAKVSERELIEGESGFLVGLLHELIFSRLRGSGIFTKDLYPIAPKDLFRRLGEVRTWPDPLSISVVLDGQSRDVHAWAVLVPSPKPITRISEAPSMAGARDAKRFCDRFLDECHPAVHTLVVSAGGCCLCYEHQPWAANRFLRVLSSTTGRSLYCMSELRGSRTVEGSWTAKQAQRLVNAMRDPTRISVERLRPCEVPVPLSGEMKNLSAVEFSNLVTLHLVSALDDSTPRRALPTKEVTRVRTFYGCRYGADPTNPFPTLELLTEADGINLLRRPARKISLEPVRAREFSELYLTSGDSESFRKKLSSLVFTIGVGLGRPVGIVRVDPGPDTLTLSVWLVRNSRKSCR